MSNMVLIVRILGGITLVLSAISISYAIIIDRDRKAFIRDMEKYPENNSDEIVTEEELFKIKSRFEDLYIKPERITIILVIIAAVLGVITILLRE